MRSHLALVVAFAAVSQCVASSDERGEPDLRIYKSFYRGGGAAASEDTGLSGQRSFPTATSNGGSFPDITTGSSSATERLHSLVVHLALNGNAPMSEPWETKTPLSNGLRPPFNIKTERSEKDG